MENKEFSKTLSARTGKDILNLIKQPEPRSQQPSSPALPGSIESILFGFWENLLGHDRFGLEDDFFKAGGNSLKAIQLLSRISAHFQVQLSLTDIFLHPTITQIARSVSSNQQDTLSLPSLLSVKKEAGRIPLSYSQERLWFIDQLEGSTHYHIPAVLRLSGQLNLDALTFAFRALLQRHEALRSVIYQDEGVPYQRLIDERSWQLSTVHADQLQHDGSALEQYIRTFIEAPFDLASDYMLRACVIRLDDTRCYLIVTMHHIASDGWSVPIIVRELSALYDAFLLQQHQPLPALPLQYADFALWQRTYLQGSALQQQLDFWKRALQGVQPLELPTDHPRPALRSTRGASLSFSIPADLSQRLQALANHQGATLFMTLLAAFKVLLYRYTAQSDIVVGTPIAGRQHQELEALVGFFVNTLALRSDVDGERSFEELLQQLKGHILQAYEHQGVPFEKVVEAVVSERDMSRSPLFDVMFVLDQDGSDALNQPHLSGLQAAVEEVVTRSAKFDLTFFVSQDAHGGLQGVVEYSLDLWHASTIRRMAAHYVKLLDSVVTEPQKPLCRLPMLSPAEEQQLLYSFNHTYAPYPSHTSIAALFEQQVDKSAHEVALLYGDSELSYAELNEQANRLAHYLRNRGVEAGSRVGICVERGLSMVVGVLAILKTGACYVPLDPDYPAERLSFMIEDAGAGIVVSAKEGRMKLESLKDLDIVHIEDEWKNVNDYPAGNLPVVSSQHLAYLIYTSGSTGMPKGVMIEHRNVVNLLKSVDHLIGFGPDSKFLSVTTFCFDICYLEFFVPLINGGKLIIVPKDTTADGIKLAEAIRLYQPTHMQGTPSTWQLLLDSGWENREGITMLIGGEAVKESVKNALTKMGNVYNLYGPTETTIWSTAKKLRADEKVLIGKPLANTSIYITGERMELVPVGVAGEICIGGAGVARGYVGNRDQTAQKFIRNPYGSDPASRIYRTGDKGRWLDDGNIEYLGRMDDQVKIRGFRIEPGEIEGVLQECTLVQQAAVVAKEDKDGNKQLVGYAVARGNYDRQGIIAYLKTRLPGYMMPTSWVQLESLPLTPSGKIDKKALPAVDLDAPAHEGYTTPVNEIQEIMAEVWQSVLQVNRVGIHDDFFELGGHSLLATRVVSAIRRQLEADINIKALFFHPTIASLEAYLRHQRNGMLPSIDATHPRPVCIPLSFSQERFWFIHQLEGSIQYHLPAVLRFRGNLHKHVLNGAFLQIINRHEILRTIIIGGQDNACQSIQEATNWRLRFHEGTLYENDSQALAGFVHTLIRAPFDLSRDYMIRADLISLDPQDHLLITTIHHIATDGWSTSIIVKELLEAYTALVDERPVQLPALPVQYADYAIWQRDALKGQLFEHKLDYWKNKLDGTPVLQLPTDYSRPAVWSARGASIRFDIEKQLTEALKKLSRQQGVTLFMTLLAAFKVMLQRYSGQHDICVGTPVANRNQPELEGLIGCFINTLALRSDLSHQPSFTALLQQLKTTTLEAYAHQEVPFEKVVEAVGHQRDMSRNPLVQVLFSMHNTPEVPALRLQDVQVTDEGYQPDTAQVDIIYNVVETAHGMEVTVVYCSDLFSEQTMWRMSGHFKQLLHAVTVSPDRRISSLKMLSPREHQLLEKLHSRSAGQPEHRTVVALFEEQAAQKPDQTALVYQEQQLSFQQLNERANQLARYLKDSGIKKETYVAVCLDRSPDLVVALLGILKAGGAYVPIDSGYPPERIAMLVEDSGSALLISSAVLDHKLPDSRRIRTVFMDTDWPLISSQDSTNLQIDITPDQLAYLIYTSGSSGKPKGVMVEHHSLSNYLINSKTSYLNAAAATSGSFVHLSCSFDASVTALFMPLVFGKLVVIASTRSAHVFEDANLHQYAPYDFIKITPSHLALLEPEMRTAAGSLLTHRLVIGGEALLVGQLSFLQHDEMDVEVINEYGPTETTVGCTVFGFRPRELQEEGGSRKNISIGKPIDHARIYILGAGNELLPEGAIGEICIAGAGVARGYLHAEDGSSKFVKDPFHKEEARMYKSGDRGRWLGDGNIEYLGRSDEQVKIRGYRIEPGEIESVLQAHREVKEVAVVVHESKEATKRLVAFVVGEGGYHEETVRAYAKEQLPDYMIPEQWIEIASMPLTVNGKIDRRRLPQVEAKELAGKEQALPRTKTEAVLAELWQNLLGLETVGIHDNFFELGGDSINSIQLVNQARKTGHMFQIDDVFNYQTIAKLASLIDEQAVPSATPYEQYSLQEHVGLLPIQQWYFEKELAEPSYFNQAILLEIDKSVEEALLRRAFEQIAAHHDVLQFKYYKKEDQWYQVYEPHSIANQVISENLQSVPMHELANILTQRSDDYQRSLDIEKGDLIRVVLMETPPSETANRLLIVVHHLVIDGVSWRILLRELEGLIGELKKGGVTDLGTKSSSYRQWYDALERWGQHTRTRSQLPYWQEVIQNYAPLPYDMQYAEPVRVRDIRHHTMRLNKLHTRTLIYDVPAAYHTEINDLLLAALANTLTQFGHTDTIVIGMEAHGREFIEEGIDTSNTLGWFTALYPLLIRVDKEGGQADLIKGVKEQIRSIPDKGLGFGVLKYINRESTLQTASPWDLLFNYLGQADNVLRNTSWFGMAKEASGFDTNPELAVNEKMTVNAIVQGGELVVDWAYSSKHYHEETIVTLVQQFHTQLELLIAHCTAQLTTAGPAYTPSDYGLAKDISYPELDKFLAEPFQGTSRKSSLESLYLLSGLQEGILFHGLYDREGAGYLNHFMCDLLHPDLDVLRKTWHYIVQSHTILRSAFDYDSFSKPVQAVYKGVQLPIEVIDYSGMNETEQRAAIGKLEEADRAKGFNFSTVPLMRIYLIRLQEDRYRMLWSAHHILFDGWSRSNIISEFLQVYELYVSGKPLPPVKEDRFEDYIRYLDRTEKDKALAYWKEYLRLVEQRTLLPFISTTPERNKGIGSYASSELNMEGETTARITRFTQHHRITLNTLMQGVWSYLLHRYTNSDCTVFGVIVSGRPDDLADVAQRVGMFINALPLCACYRKEQPVAAWLQGIQHDQVTSRNYQYVPLGEIQNLTGLQGDLFDSLLVVENYPVSKAIASGSKHLAVENIAISEQTNFPLTIFIEQAEQITIRFSYNTDLLKPEWVREISGHFEQVLFQIIEDGQRRLGEIELLAAAEKDQLLLRFNDTKAGYSTSRPVPDLFELQAARVPESLALVMYDEQISYRALNEQANQIAHYLQTQGVKQDTLVPICMERSIEMVAGMLGILKAGGAYVPIDPEYPVSRLLYTIEDSGASLILTNRRNIHKLPPGSDCKVVSLDADWPLICSQPSTNLSLDIHPDQLAYVIYTSGSTGKPKGVMISHGNVQAFINWCTQEFASTRFDILYAGTSICFDLSIFELFYPLSIGKPVRLLENGLQIGKHLDTDSFVMINTVPSVIQSLLAEKTDFSSISAINMAGEVITAQVLQNLDTGKIEVRNLYGPTESTTYSTVCRLKNSVPVTIGKPISNTRIYILNQENQLAPVGVKGEICIAGAGLSKGYLNRPELTADKFVTDPFASAPGERMYRTGDWGCWLADGNLEYLGRMDNQVKIRGYRIEPGEIESVLLQSSLVSKAAVVVIPAGLGKDQLVAYVVPAASYQKLSVISYLKERLPDYMLPGSWVEMDDFPLTPNGKIDRKALPHTAALLGSQYVAPRTELETQLADMWKEILQVEHIGVCDDFFELGGNSILAMRLTSSIRREYKIELPVRLFFELRTVEELASYIKVNQHIVQLNPEDYETLKL